jgi:hypothetical protein
MKNNLVDFILMIMWRDENSLELKQTEASIQELLNDANKDYKI